jgi:hypothetical protein
MESVMVGVGSDILLTNRHSSTVERVVVDS